jgi:hypothetical protein
VVARTPDEADYLQSNFVTRRCSDLFYACCVQGGRPNYEGPARIFPGAIAVSRSLGDLELKYSKLVVSAPEMKYVRVAAMHYLRHGHLCVGIGFGFDCFCTV